MKSTALALAALTLALFLPTPVTAQEVPVFLRDRGTGVATSMFGTYIRRGELIVYPFFEYYRDKDFEYAPEEFGAVGADDFRGRYRAKEALLLLAYGVTDDLAIEFEVAAIDATFEKAPDDLSSLPAKIEESGLGDVEGQVRYRWRRETPDGGPELFSYAELVLPHDEDKPLIGTDGVEIKLGTGATRGFTWGTVTARAAIEYAQSSSSAFDVGEFAFEYLKRLSPRVRVFAAIEGTSDEISLITELQWHVSPRAMIKLNNGVGLTSKATDWAPEVGVLFTIPTARSR